MAIQTGSATDHKDLLARLVTFATANGWVSEAYTTQVGDDTADVAYLRGLGSADTENVHVNISTFGDTFNNVFTWDVYGATAYDGAQGLTLQPGVSPVSRFFMTNSSMTYWFYVSDRRIIVVIQAGTVFFAMYAGFFLPFATPLEYPFPMYIGATSGTRATTTHPNTCLLYTSDAADE